MQRGFACAAPVGTIVSLQGNVEVRSAADQGQAAWTPARLQQKLCAEDQIAVRERSRAAVELINQIVVRLDQHTTLTLQKMAADQPAEISLLEGIVHVLTRFTHKFSVITPYLNAMVEGTEFIVMADTQAQRGQITVAEGQVRAVNQHGVQVLSADHTVIANAASAPTAPLLITPRAALQWALYYPQIANLDERDVAALSPALRKPISAAHTLANQGKYQQALVALEQAPDKLATPALQAWHANLLLSVGRLDEARTILGNAEQLPLRSLIETTLGNTKQALALAQQAAATDKDSAAAELALSLALQAQGELPPATAAALRATQLDAQFPLAWVRLAELELLNANARQGRAFAQHALQLDPNTTKAYTVWGFAELMSNRYAQAQTAFERAKQSDAPDAQAWLGSGLVLLHDGQLAPGRRHLEIAAMLDPGNAELRNLLARAYLKEGRDAVAVKELGLAQRLDPANPSTWFTEALRKQQLNDLVGALQAYQQSLALNEQRAVVRPRALLDQDKAGRMVSLASTYRDLGFDGLMLATAERAVAADPDSAVAHGFLAEAFTTLPRYEDARVSEQLQAQLRAPIGMAPVAPQSLLTTLPIVGGARALTLQEFTPLLDRNNAGLQLGALLGSQSTHGTSATGFTTWHNLQISAGHFYYDTNGAINDTPIRLNANNVLLQLQVTPALQAQLEGRSERRDGGDVTERINPLSAEPERHRYLKNDSIRFGLSEVLSAQSQWLLSAVHRDRMDVTDDVSRVDVPGLTITSHQNLRKPTLANDLESQMLFQSGNWHLATGVSLYHDSTEALAHIITELSIAPPGFPPQVDDTSTKVGIEHRNAYVYTSYRLGGLKLDAGVTWDDFKREDGIAIQRTSPKLGGEYAWQNTRLHAALFSGVKGSSAREQSLEFTQFSGFNQVFDDFDGTRYKRIAAGLEHDWNSNVNSGAEWSRRKLDIPNYGCNTAPCFGEWQEQVHRLYGSWAINTQWALGADALYESSRLEQPDNYNYPIAMRTWQVPVKLAYLPSAKWRLNAEWRGVKQAVSNQQSIDATTEQTSTVKSSFGIVNLGVRYGLAASSWSVALELNNAFDRQFRFQGTTIGGEPVVPLFTSERSMALRCSVRL